MNPKTIALLHGGALGDFVLAWHLFKALPSAREEHLLRVWARRPVAGSDPILWGVASLRDLESCGLHTLFAEDGACPDDLAADLKSCTWLVNFLTDRGSVLTRNLRRVTEAALLCVEPKPVGSGSGHITEQWCRQLRQQGVHIPYVGPSTLSLPAQAVEEARQWLESMVPAEAGPIALIHPGSGGSAKCWPLDNFVQLADALQRWGVGSVFVTGPVEREILGPAQHGLLGDRPVIAHPTLSDLMCLCAAADLCVGNDSGFSQLAAAAPGSTLLVVFGSTDPAVWLPLGPCVRALGTPGSWPAWAQVLSHAQELLSPWGNSAQGA